MLVALLLAVVAAAASVSDSDSPSCPVRTKECHCPQCIGGCPVRASNNVVLSRAVSTLSNNATSKFADWVAYVVTADTIGSGKHRYWRQDPCLDESITLEPDDYQDAHADIHTDRGHQAPLASLAGMKEWEDTNFLSNITPQKSDLNQGPWATLEQKERDIAEQGFTVHTVTGPVFLRDMDTLPADKDAVVPSGYFKLITVAIQRDRPDVFETAAFFFDQDTERHANYCDHFTTVDAVEAMNGYDFFSNSTSVANFEACRASPQLYKLLGCEAPASSLCQHTAFQA